MSAESRFWFGDRYVFVGDWLELEDGRSARVRGFAALGTLPEGVWVWDPRTGSVCAVTEASTVWPVVIGDDLCCMPAEIMPVLDLI